MTLERHLANWVLFMRRNKLTLGYPSKSLGLESGGSAGSEEFDHLADNEETKSASEFDSCVESLKSSRRAAIHHIYLHSTYRFQDLTLNLDCAMIDLHTIARRRGINIT